MSEESGTLTEEQVEWLEAKVRDKDFIKTFSPQKEAPQPDLVGYKCLTGFRSFSFLR